MAPNALKSRPELVSGSHRISYQETGDFASGVLKQVQHDIFIN